MTLLIFDCDGVLVDSEILHAEIETELGRDLLGIDRDPRTHARLFTGRGLKSLFAAWEGECGHPLPPDIEEEMARRKSHAFTTRLAATPFVAEALDALSAFPRCVASGTPVETLTIALRATGLYDHFAPHLFSSAMVARGKPAPDVFLYAAAGMDAHPADCIVIEDSEHGVRAALAADMDVIGFVGGSHCGERHADTLRGAAHIIRDMRELPGAIARMRAM